MPRPDHPPPLQEEGKAEMTPEEYAMAIEQAKELAGGDFLLPAALEQSFHIHELAGMVARINGSRELLSRALLHAHAARRTPGTVEICTLCKLPPHKDPENCPGVDCPVRGKV